MLIDTGADVTLVPEGVLGLLELAPTLGAAYTLIGFGGESRVLSAVQLEMVFLRRTFRGLFLPHDQTWGILGRNVLNALALVLDGTRLTWDEYARHAQDS